MKKNIDVFDFNEEDELAESASGKLLEKFANPSSSVSPILQCGRIQSFCQEEPALKEVEGASCAEAATDVVDRHCEDAPALATEPDDFSKDHLTESDVNHGLVFGLNTEDREKEADVDEDNHGLMFGFDIEDHMKETDADHGLESFSCQPSAKSFYAETSSYSQPQLNSPFSDSSSSPERTDMMSAIDESLSDRSALSEASDSEGDEDWMSEHCFDDMEKIDRNTAVIMIPEYVVLKDMPCAPSLVIFSCNGIKIKSYPDNNEEGPFCCEFGVEDIVSIQYNWYQNVGVIILRIRVLLKDEKCHEDRQHTTDIEELKFAVKDHNWPEKQQQINSLHVKYPAVWSADLDEDVEVSGDNLHQRKRYFPRFDEPFEDVVYPKGDPDAVSVCKRDVELLQPETFVNDTIIDFYINYLKNQIQAEERQRFHFFNSFFFRKLADLDKDPSSIADGKAAFLRVRKWTRKVDMFGKDYIFVPVNFSLHWSLIIICHPGEVANGTDLDLEDSPKVPCILHMDSIKGSHAGLKNLVQSYLCEEWKERHKETSDDISSRFMNLRFVSLELPQQENSFDCGLFLLHYLELFLAEAPQNFSPFKIYNASNFLYLNWFPPAEASLKRTLIEKLIFELLENRSREVINEQDQSCESPVPVNNKTGIEVLSGRCTSLIDCNGNMTQTQEEQGIEMTLLERSAMRNMQAVNDSGMVLRDLFDAGASNTGSLLGQLQQTFDEPSSFYHLSNNSLATEQVEMESGEQFMCLNSGEGSNFQRITGTASPRASASFSSLNLSMMSVQKEGVADSLSNDSEDIGIIEETGESPSRETVSLFSATLGPSTDHNTENDELPSTQDELVVASSQDGRDEEKQLEDDVGIEEETSEDLKMGDKMSGDLVIEDKTSDAPGIGDKTSEVLGIEEKTNEDPAIEDKTSEVPGIVDKMSEDLGIEEDKISKDLGIEKTRDDLGIEEKTSEDVGDDCGDKKEKEKEPMEEEEAKRAAKRPRLSSTGEVEEMEINNWSCRLEYAQKYKLPTPIYETVKEGPSHKSLFQSTVIVDGVRYDSLPGFFNRKAAEQSAAEVALQELSKSTELGQCVSLPVHEMGLCKNLLQEYAQKMNYAIPLYQCQKSETTGRAPQFTCTVEIGGIKYTGAATKTKREAEISAGRTALIAIQSESKIDLANNHSTQLTVLPCEKKTVEVASPVKETIKTPKARRAQFKRKAKKGKRKAAGTIIPPEPTEHCQNDQQPENVEKTLNLEPSSCLNGFKEDSTFASVETEANLA